MCGRYTQVRPWSELVEIYRLAESLSPSNFPARYNIAPTQDVPIVRPIDGDERELILARWGLIPFWAKDIKIGYRTINARAETVDSKPSFRDAFKRRRCLIAADGFYEWKPLGGRKKQPYYITLPRDRPFAFAGLWEAWKSPEGEKIESCTIIVTAANEQLEPIHDRMPVILEPDQFDAWLDTSSPLDDARALLQPFDGEMTAYPVSQRVNNVRNDDPGCIERMSE
jgi:putative SOS response-associated peptidase YedK